MAQPLILVTATSRRIARPYARSLQRHGAEVVFATPRKAPPADDPLGGATGLLLTGGPDLDPALYGQTPDSSAGVESNRSRDDMEMALLRHALDRDIPVLAICRGMQLLNVAFGGKLIQDLPDHRAEHQNGRWESVYHQTYLAPGTRIAAVLGVGGFFRLNSRHHQGLREPQKSPDLLASAYSLGDGIIEALESPTHRWVLGIQCHPEREDETPRAFARLFQRLVERAGTEAERTA